MQKLGAYDTLSDFALAELRLLKKENKSRLKNIYERPDVNKWENRDCQKCYSPFSVIKEGKIWKCYNCGSCA